MELNVIKELTPVAYGESAVRVLHFVKQSGATCFSLHWHERMEFLRIKSGALQLQCGEQTLVAKADELVILCPRQMHRGIAGESGVAYDVIMFDPERFVNAIDLVKRQLDDIRSCHVVFAPLTTNPLLLKTADDITSCGEDDAMKAVGLVYCLIGQLYQHCAPRRILLEAADRKFSEVIAYVDGHYTENIGAASLSAMFGYDESYFCRRFKKATGLTVIRYILISRLERAKKLLRYTSCEISAVAQQCGFQDAGYFTHRFTGHYGLSPSEYRKAQK